MIDPTNFYCSFRSATSEDYSAIHSLLFDGWVETYGPRVSSVSVRRFDDEDAVGEHLRLFLGTMQVAIIEGEVVGVVNQFEEFITALCVAPSVRRNRIGWSLLHNATVAGGRHLQVAAFNKPAIAFYRRAGWRKTGTCTEDWFGTPMRVLVMTIDVRVVSPEQRGLDHDHACLLSSC